MQCLDPTFVCLWFSSAIPFLFSRKNAIAAFWRSATNAGRKIATLEPVGIDNKQRENPNCFEMEAKCEAREAN